MRYKYTAEELFELPEYKNAFCADFGDMERDSSVKEKLEKDIARTINYVENIFYHAGNETREAGLGDGLYLGKDKKALHNFYNLGGILGNSMKTYKGEPNFLDLSEPHSLSSFEEVAIRKYGNQKNKNYLRFATLDKGFDGIRYFDPSATGEEFVLFDTSKIELVSENDFVGERE